MVACNTNYKDIFDKSPFPFSIYKVIFDEQNNPVGFVLVNANKAFEKYTGLKLTHILNKSVEEVILGTNNKSFSEIFKMVVTTGNTIHFEDVFGPLNRYYHISVYKLDEETVATAIQCLTEQRYYHDSLKESELKYRTLFKSRLSPVFVVDAEGNYKDANNAALEFLETNLDSLRQKKVGDYDSVRLQGKQVEEHSPFLEPKTVETYYEVSGKEKVLLLNIVPVNTKEGIRLFGIGQEITERKQYEEESRKKERQLLNAIKIAKLGQWELDVQSGIFTFSDSFYDIFHTNIEEMGSYEMSIDDYACKFVHPEDRHFVSEETLKAIESDDPNFSRYMEHRMLYADSSVGFMAVQFFIVKDANGKTIKTYGVNQDITERKQTADALKESEARLKTALKNSPVVLFNQDLELRYTWIHNPNPLFDPNSVIGKNDYDLLPAEDAACLTSIKRAAIETGIKRREEVRTTIEGQPFFYDLTVEPLSDSAGEIVGVSCASIDITERRRAEEALASKSAFDRIVSENVHNFLRREKLDHSIDKCLTDLGNVCKAERAYLFQFNSDGVTMSNTNEWCAPGVRSEIEKLQNLPIDLFPWWMELLQKGKSIPIENVAELPPEACNEKEILEAQNIKSLLFVPFMVKNEMAGFIGFDNIYFTRKWSEKELVALTLLADIIGIAIERKRSEEELIIAKEAAETANIAKSEFLSIMSHELRTPMNAVIGFTDILSETELTNAQQRYVEIVKKSSDRLLLLIEDILDLVKIEEGKFELEKLDFDLLEIMKTIIDAMRLRANEKGLKIFYTIEDNVPLQLFGDKYRLIQILTNLLSNSLKFTHTGYVAIHIFVESHEDDAVVLRFVVHDTGIGIPEEKMSLLFESFYQIDGSNTRRFGGAGLGLSISKKLVAMMEGDMGVSSEVGKGSDFWFTVKVRMQTKYVREEEPKLLQNNNGDLMILLVEDDIFNQELAQTMLNKMGHNVDTVNNGLEALKALETVPYDLVLMDIQMPVMDGIEATRQIRSPESTVLNKNVPIIALTAHAMKGDMELFIQEGMDDYISKPITIKSLKELLDKWRDYS